MEGQNIRTNKYLIVIAGPTAVGKTSNAIQLAQKFHCEIFSADSRQVYSELNIGTAKPTNDEMKGVVHHLIGHKSIHNHYTVGHYVKELEGLLEGYFMNNPIALLTGGTGLYIKSLLQGLDDFPDVPKENSEKYINLFEKEGIAALQELLKKQDPEYFQKVDINNGHRLIRALSVIESSGKPFSSYLTKPKKTLPFKPIKIYLERPREELYERINIRVNKMVEDGLIEEARTLYPHRKFLSLQTVGYKELFSYFDGNCTYQEAIETIKRNSRRYAKRQSTWFRNQGDWKSFHPDEVDEISKYIKAQMGEIIINNI